MRPVRFVTLCCIALGVAVLAPARRAAATPFNASWYASTGLQPDAGCPAWTPVVPGSSIGFTADGMDISTSACASNASWWQSGAEIVVPDTLVVEARMRVQSGGECVGPCGHYRAGAGIWVTVAANVGTLFFVGTDQIFLTTSECGGLTVAAVPTTDAMHTYRLQVIGSTVTVFRDGVPALTATTYASASDHSPTPRVGWGEGSSFAYGASRWEYVRHNAHATGCATAGVPALAGGGPLLRDVRAWPNPASGSMRIGWTLATPARVRVDLFDAAGRLVRRVSDAPSGAGPGDAAWDGRDGRGRTLPAGAYLCRIRAGADEVVRRIVRER